MKFNVRCIALLITGMVKKHLYRYLDINLVTQWTWELRLNTNKDEIKRTSRSSHRLQIIVLKTWAQHYLYSVHWKENIELICASRKKYGNVMMWHKVNVGSELEKHWRTFDDHPIQPPVFLWVNPTVGWRLQNLFGIHIQQTRMHSDKTLLGIVNRLKSQTVLTISHINGHIHMHAVLILEYDSSMFHTSSLWLLMHLL